MTYTPQKSSCKMTYTPQKIILQNDLYAQKSSCNLTYTPIFVHYVVFYLLKYVSTTLIHDIANKHWCFGGFYPAI